MVTTLQHHDSKAMSVNVALCGSIPRAHLTKPLAPLFKDRRTDGGRCGNGLTLLSQAPNLVSQNNENMRPVERQQTGHVFDAPSWAVPTPGEARLEVRPKTEPHPFVWWRAFLN